ncbi:glycogen phosphorylase [Mycolicibacterium duvalii]|uniref:Alpha-1,4 glucan phosphorylase n=1 Tax=Mycolicibacterium duvalii TaxID=39688 RepID=A0A7I7K3H7_9MYCO|nr:glycogen/starch/alpha-glucan phosphorylase [Mycolicibacterium duvalii]MCV7367775.1 glycogen/starch/alpha-glucan phosphorylase [Mycolicibacterium duvalii]PEG42466.1 glycogen phosphorylase [Mycolicibacterium duvalii]BBX18635.1 alpha-1,4 glucan phosphorylase [Mycolicibacterium duvalii]
MTDVRDAPSSQVNGAAAGPTGQTRTGLGADALRAAVTDHLVYSIARPPAVLTPEHYYRALSLAVRDRMQKRWMATTQNWLDLSAKVVCYLSAEFLMGPQLGNNLIALGIEEQARAAMAELGQDLDVILACEGEPGLGNGGLGRLAACYLDSLAALERPAVGYGIRYEFGIFSQEISDGWQVEKTDNWLAHGNPWEIAKPDASYQVNWGGHTEGYTDVTGRRRVRWVPQRVLKGVSYDTPVQGYGVNTCNTLTLWSARAVESFALDAFNTGDFYRAVDEEVISETVSKVLYPNDEPEAGKRLRLLQQYFFVTCSLQDILDIHLHRAHRPLAALPDKWAIQLNDTHPSIAVAELMRLLIDEHQLEWNTAWDLTVRTFGYTNHTLLPEALETWPLSIFGEALPRHLELIYEINARFLDEVRAAFPGDEDRVRRMSLISEDGQTVRMAHLATVGSHTVNGVAALHSELLKSSVLKDFHEMWPQRFGNVTNGVTPRRFLALSNPGLRELLDDTIGPGWMTNLDRLKGLEASIGDPEFRRRWREIKRANKSRLAEYVHASTGIELDPTWMFDVQVKRIHEYKRQHLMALHIIALYHRLKTEPGLVIPPRAFIFGGKAAPGYHMAKRIIKLINAVGETVNADPEVNRCLKVVFLPNFNVKTAHLVYPAANLSEQISTAGKEASGTGNMKFMINGALTIGTLDGANVEIRQEAGAENFFLFGLTEEQVAEVQANGYRPLSHVESDPELAAVLELIARGEFTRGDTEVLRPIVDNLVHHDPFLVLADYRSYVDRQAEVSKVWLDRDAWSRMSIRNTARSGRFSSDRAIQEYCAQIWGVGPMSVPL